ncbi:MAG: spore photoproduct lyase family protein [Gammaproteobacteria bacterium]
MIDTLYIEENLLSHPRALDIAARFPNARRIACGRYSEVFNPKAQNFRLQKRQPALILAEKFKNFALPTPAGYGIGARRNYYFSHMLNCLYDCRYCFLQGMYQSAHYVLFVNYEDFQQDIRRLCLTHPEDEVHFFSGYDCDSLALEPVTGFAAHFLPFFATLPNAWLELRTKSTQIRTLLTQAPLPRCVVAFSLSPDAIAEKVEHKAPSLQRRLEAICKLQDQGWTIGLRFDPVIFQSGYQAQYRQFFDAVFARVDPNRLHSVSLGSFRLPDHYFKKMQKLYPDERLFAGPLQSVDGMTGYERSRETDMINFCSALLSNYISERIFYPCQP